MAYQGALGCRGAAGKGHGSPTLLQGRILLGPEGIPLQKVDILAANGVIHMLDGVLLPPTILPILPKHCDEERHQIVEVRVLAPGFLLWEEPLNLLQ